MDELFADISSLTAMPFPNLVYRVLAQEPGRLSACWSRVRPGLALVGAAALRERFAALAMTPTPDPHATAGAAASAATGAGAAASAEDSAAANLPITDDPRLFLNESRRRTLLDVLDVYDRGNSCNAVLVSLLLDGAPGKPASTLVSPAAPVSPVTPQPPVVRATVRSPVPPVPGSPSPPVQPSLPEPVRAAGRPPLPPMLELDHMDKSVRARILELARIAEPGGEVVPSLLRHIAHDGVLVDAVADTVQSAVSDGSFERLCTEVMTARAAMVDDWPEAVAPLTDPDTRALLEPFARTIPRMLAVSALLHAAYGAVGYTVNQ